MDRQCGYVHTMEYYSALKRGDIPIHVTSETISENILLSETKPDTKGHILLYRIPLILRDTKQMRSYQGLEGIRRGNYCLLGTECGMMKTFWKLTAVVAARGE